MLPTKSKIKEVLKGESPWNLSSFDWKKFDVLFKPMLTVDSEYITNLFTKDEWMELTGISIPEPLLLLIVNIRWGRDLGDCYLLRSIVDVHQFLWLLDKKSSNSGYSRYSILEYVEIQVEDY